MSEKKLEGIKIFYEMILYVDNVKYDPNIKCDCHCVNEHTCSCTNNCDSNCECIKCSFTEEEIIEIKKELKNKYFK